MQLQAFKDQLPKKEQEKFAKTLIQRVIHIKNVLGSTSVPSAIQKIMGHTYVPSQNNKS